MKTYSIAIDGPAGAGKTTLAKALAKDLGFVYVDTGAMYRAFAVHKLEKEREGQAATIESTLDTFDFDITRDETGEQRILVCGVDVTDRLRTPEVSMVASDTSAHPAVRQALLGCQRRMAQGCNSVMEGRDIGTVVLPGADLKIFLTADSEIRAERRHKELLAKGGDSIPSFAEVLADLVTRDYNDSHRTTAPLKQADDAVLLDNSHLNIAETTKMAKMLFASVETGK